MKPEEYIKEIKHFEEEADRIIIKYKKKEGNELQKM